jgi:membrane associated rhomboid family serine protease
MLATLLLAAALLGAYSLELTLGGDAVCQAYGLVPAHPTLNTAISSLFLHDPGNVFHIGGNLVFLLVFGSIVEREIGSLRFLGLFFAAGLGGATMHACVNQGSGTPLVGASGALFGLLALAGVLRPRLLGFVVAYAGWTIWQAFSGGDGSVSFGCHIGGFIVGAIVAVFIRVAGCELEAA